MPCTASLTQTAATDNTPASAPAPKVKAKKEAPKAETAGEHGTTRSKDLPWSDKKVAVFKALKALKATTASQAVGTSQVAEKAGLTNRDVRHYCYHAAAGGLVGMATLQEGTGKGFYLTKKGANVDPVKALKDQEAAK